MSLRINDLQLGQDRMETLMPNGHPRKWSARGIGDLVLEVKIFVYRSLVADIGHQRMQ